MVKHIVCFKLKNNTLEDKNQAKEILMSMKGKVPEIRDIMVGVDFLESPRSYDVILEVLLDSREALGEYQTNKYHCEIVKPYMAKVRETSIAVDYDI